MQSHNVIGSNTHKIAQLFPNCVTERLGKDGKPELAIDFEKLQAELSNEIITEGEERYQFTWPDKRAAVRLANTPTTMTLRPCREESVDFDNTQNLYIEGDNLDVLKVLRETYLGKVKMIYIDPPYNTGNDFVYNDDFGKDKGTFEETSGLFDEEGNQTIDPMQRNTESNGRFHTDWLNMIYPRLKVARDLLSDDGVIFISIDDCEVENLRKVCDEVFGEANFVAQFDWMKTSTPPSLSKTIRKKFEYILCFAKNKVGLTLNGGTVEGGDMPLLNEINAYATITFPQNSIEFRISDGHYEAGLYDRVYLENAIDIINGKATTDIILSGNFKWKQQTVIEEVKNGTIFRIKTEKFAIRYERLGERIKLPSNIISKEECEVGTNEDGQKDIKRLFDNQCIMDYPKPVSLMRYIVRMNTYNDDLILDFFSGSATTAHAVMKLNAEDGGNRKFIMVQLPEKTEEKSEAYKAGYKNICEIGKERIRRAGKKIRDDIQNKIQTLGFTINSLLNEKLSATVAMLPKQEQEAIAKKVYNEQILPKMKEKEQLELRLAKLDTGFRVLKLDTSNMEDVYYTPQKFELQSLFNENVKTDRTNEDLLFQVMLDLGIELSAKIDSKQIAGKNVHFVDDNYLVACFDRDVNESTITEIAKLQPIYFVMRDASAANDNVIDNFEQIFKHYSPDTNCRII